ncbi:GNAT family N-acetyltransferase [Vibrio sp. ZSDE26]|uniref:GNAT family N-acetyltransferase n=1 Tax=Vibrio amylolyticus TaxID=2847292 RepID=A0A9X1XGS4_9VIBR|nr:GNAT family N-acetyltransferase [Vibrio amylolyticus]MCK6261690.1 GNAT family N-acetyltransferase [Vibrio amylolyticus]
MINIEKLCKSHFDAVRLITLADEQIKFAGTADDFLSQGSDTTHLHIIKDQDTIVGFFKLDTAYASSHDFCPGSGLGLRAFVIDNKQQGKGLGTKAVTALFPYLKNHYASFDSIYLTVNCKNPSAKACYLKGGFEDTGKLYLGGAAGPQTIMRGQIKP